MVLPKVLRKMRARLALNWRTTAHASANAKALRTAIAQRRVFFSDELQALLGRSPSWLLETFEEFRHTPEAWKRLCQLRSNSSSTDGFAKSFDVAEGFAAWAVVKHARPKVVVELGTQFGVTARLWKEALTKYVPGHELILCDLVDSRRYINGSEARMVVGDAMKTLPGVFQAYDIGLLFNDAHPYSLIRWSVEEGLRRGVPVLAFHDVGRLNRRRPYKPEFATLDQNAKVQHDIDWGTCGHWERHVMAEIFGRELLDHESVSAGNHQVQIFDSLFGFAAVLDRQRVMARESAKGRA